MDFDQEKGSGKEDDGEEIPLRGWALKSGGRS
jgi:hypothetical protein